MAHSSRHIGHPSPNSTKSKRISRKTSGLAVTRYKASRLPSSFQSTRRGAPGKISSRLHCVRRPLLYISHRLVQAAQLSLVPCRILLRKDISNQVKRGLRRDKEAWEAKARAAAPADTAPKPEIIQGTGTQDMEATQEEENQILDHAATRPDATAAGGNGDEQAQLRAIINDQETDDWLTKNGKLPKASHKESDAHEHAHVQSILNDPDTHNCLTKNGKLSKENYKESILALTSGDPDDEDWLQGAIRSNTNDEKRPAGTSAEPGLAPNAPQLQRQQNTLPVSAPGAFSAAPGSAPRQQQMLNYADAINEGQNNIEAKVRSTTPASNPDRTGTDVEQLGGQNGEDLAVANPVQDEAQHLPKAEDVDVDAQEVRRKMHQQKNQKLALTGALIIGILLVVVCLSIRSKKEEPMTLTNTPSVSPTLAPTTVRDGVMAVLPEATKRTILEDPSSPQARAYEWLLGHDGINEYPSWRKVQRFALACFYYAMNGDEWWNNTHWLEYDFHECDWPNFNTSVGLMELFDEKTGETTGYEFFAPTKPCFSASINTTDRMEVFQHLWLPGNGLEGTIPEEIGLLTSLRSLALHESNGGVKGSIPTTVGLLTSLELLAITFSDLQGTAIPSELGQCPKLRGLDLTRANLGGSIPSQVGNLKLLEYFMIDQEMTQGMTGTLPSQLGQLEELKSFFALESGIGGQIPSEIGLMTSLFELDLGMSNFEGTVPTQVGLLTGLQYLNFGVNTLTGQLPSQLGLLQELYFLVGRHNSFTGSIPSLGEMPWLWIFSLRHNQLSGAIPSELGLVGKYGMEDFRLEDNQLTGPIPSELGLLDVGTFLVQNNNLSGKVPPELGSVQNLWKFNISNNDLLTGTVPIELCYLGSSNCIYSLWGEPVSCQLDFACSDYLCGCDCPCGNASQV